MNNTISKAISLGVGLAVASKEQVEKVIDDLVSKGEVTRSESSALMNELMEKGSETKRYLEEKTREYIRQISGEKESETAAAFARIEKRLDALERQQQSSGQ